MLLFQLLCLIQVRQGTVKYPRKKELSALVWYVPQSEPGAGDQKNAAPPAGDEKMEVDQIADGAGDASNAQPPSEPRQSLKDALKKMAAETDFLGFTPLLRACQVCVIYYTDTFSPLVWTQNGCIQIVNSGLKGVPRNRAICPTDSVPLLTIYLWMFPMHLSPPLLSTHGDFCQMCRLWYADQLIPSSDFASCWLTARCMILSMYRQSNVLNFYSTVWYEAWTLHMCSERQMKYCVKWGAEIAWVHNHCKR